MQQKFYVALDKEDDDLYLQAIEGMKNMGLTNKMIHEQVEQTLQMVRKKFAFF